MVSGKIIFEKKKMYVQKKIISENISISPECGHRALISIR